MTLSATSVLTSIPSPTVSYFDVGPLRIHFYALCIIAGIIVATLLTNHRLTRRGAEPWVIIDIALICVPLGIIAARIYHVLTHYAFYFGTGRNPWTAFAIWQGGIAIFGALIGGWLGALLACKWTGMRFWTFADALAPGIIIAQAMGRLGNYFNNELFGLPTTWPWGLQIQSNNPAFPIGLAPGTLFQPTFLYEMIWNLLGAAVLMWAGRKFTLQWGRLFGLYLIWYGAGRSVWETIRVDPSDVFLGIRTNVWAAFGAIVVGVVIMIVQRHRHPGLEPSPYRVGRGWKSRDALQSENPPRFVDVSEPASDTNAAADVTSADAASAVPTT